MLIVEVVGFTATWDDADLRWESANKDVAYLLNHTVPTEDIEGVHVNFLEGGRPRIVLEAAKKELGAKLTVLKNTDELGPVEETPGAED